MVTASWADRAYALAENLGVAKEQVLILPSDFETWSKERARSFAAEILDEAVRRLTRKDQLHDTKTAELQSIESNDPTASESLFLENGWTDGFPIVLPTRERVQAMVAAVQREPHELVAVLPPLWGAATVEKLAVNAVMAGCRPEYFKVVLAAVEAMADPAFDLMAHATCTSSTTPMFIVNGPVRHSLNMNAGYSVFGSVAQANATMGRALRLVRLNVGGQVPGLTDMSTFGYPGGHSLCIAEDEEHSPWDPLHVQRGFRAEDSTVTVAGVVTFQNMCHQRTKQLDSLLTIIASGVAQMGYRDFQADPLEVGNVLVMLAPAYARLFAAAGFSLRDMQLALRDRAKLGLDLFPAELLPNLERGGRIKGGYVYSVANPDQILIFVAGGFNGSAVGTEPAVVMHTNHQDWKIVTKRVHHNSHAGESKAA